MASLQRTEEAGFLTCAQHLELCDELESLHQHRVQHKAQLEAQSRFNEEDHCEGWLFRLFVGWVPKTYTEKDLLPLFIKYGQVRDIIVLKDKLTSQPRGCAFVSYASRLEADLAICSLDRQLQLPGALSLLEVRFAKSHQYVQAGSGPNNNRQLFFSSAAVNLTEDDITIIFNQFGEIEEINLFRERKTGESKGCGFVTMQTRDDAVRALESMEKPRPGQSPSSMQVQWADPELQARKKKALDESNADNRMLFFAKVLRTASEEEIKAMFSKFGKVFEINLFRAFQGAPTTKGCGIVTMGAHEEAVAVIDALDNRFLWEGMESPMVVKWMDAALQRRRREQHLAAIRQSMLPNLGSAPDAWMSPQTALGSVPGTARINLGPSYMPQEVTVSETPPPGCNPDAIKLFVGNIPKLCTEEQLNPFFETVGKVVELVIVRDRTSHESKGSAFVWYATRAHAERAILQFNLRHVLPDPEGEQVRPLVVRKAKPRSFKSAGPSNSNQSLGTLSVSSLTNNSQHLGSVNSSQTLICASSSGQWQSQNASSQQLPMLGGGQMVIGHQNMAAPPGTCYQTGPGVFELSASGLVAPSLEIRQPQAMGMQGQSGLTYVGMPSIGSGIMAMNMGGYRSIQAGGQLLGMQAGPTNDSGLYETHGTGGASDQVEQYQLGSGSSSQLMMLQHSGLDGMGGSSLMLTLPLSPQQLIMVNQHMYSVMSMSGAQLNTTATSPGQFQLVMNGQKSQVESAHTLMSSVLGQVIM